MPAIPTVTSPQFTPAPEINPRVAGQPGQALAQTGDTLTQDSDLFANAAAHIKKAQDEGIMLDAENKITADIDQAASGLKTWTDYTNADQLKEQTADAMKAKYGEKYGNRPDLMRFIDPQIDRELNKFNASVDVRATKLMVDFNRGALINSQVQAENQAAGTTDLDQKETIWARQDAKTDLMVQNGTMQADEGEVAKKVLRTRTIQTEVNLASNPLNSPAVMRAQLERLNTYAGKGYVDPDTLSRMQETLGRSIEVAENRTNRIETEDKGNAVINTYKVDPTLKNPETGEFDPMLAAKRLDDDKDVDPKTRSWAREELKQQAGVQRQLETEHNQKALDDLDPQVENGKLTASTIAARQNLPRSDKNYIPRQVADHLITRAGQIQRENRVENMQERGLMRQARADKSADIRDSLLSQPGYLTSQSDLTQSRLDGLSAGDANIVWKVKDVTGDPAWGMAVKQMQSSSLYDTTTDEGKAKMSKDLLSFAQTVHDKKLTGSQITDELTRQLKPQEEAQKKSVIGTMLDNIWPIAKSYVTGSPYVPPVSAAGTKAPTSRKEYFDGVKNANKNATDEQINAYLDSKGIK